MSKLNIVFSASSFDNFQHCKAKFNLSHNLRKGVPITEKAKGMDFGGLAHKGLEVYYAGIRDGIHFSDRMHSTLRAIQAAATNTDQSNVDIETELPIILKAIEESCDYWRHEDEYFEILAIEEPFDYILFEDDYLRIIISGKIDLLVNKYKSNGELEYANLPLDHKTYQRAFPVDRLNNQFINYCVPVESNFLYYNGIGLQKTLPAIEKFRRIPLSYDKAFIQQWKDNTTKVILNEYLTCMKENHWPMNPTACRKYGRLCEFHPYCDASGEETKAWKLESLYVDREPFDKYKEAEVE